MTNFCFSFARFKRVVPRKCVPVLVALCLCLLVLLLCEWRNSSLKASLGSEGVSTPLTAIPCETVHVACVVGGSATARQVITLVKSVLLHRSLPLHFHFVCDARAEVILRALYESWMLAGVQVSIYRADAVFPHVSWIPNRHYSGIFGLLKLTLPELLPLERVIILDTDLLVLSDVATLWREFDAMSTDSPLGLVDNHSDWYLGTLAVEPNPWPAVGRGFNTGLILMNLSKLRAIKFHDIWREVAKQQLVRKRETGLADQDIFNAVLKFNPHMVHRIACSWNLQLGHNSDSSFCLAKITQIHVLHYNRPEKLGFGSDNGAADAMMDPFLNLHKTVTTLDGDVFRTFLSVCNITSSYTVGEAEDKGTVLEDFSILPTVSYGTLITDAEKQKAYTSRVASLNAASDACYSFHLAGLISRRVHPFMIEAKLPTIDLPANITLVTQLSASDRLGMLWRVCQEWDGFISAAVYLRDSQIDSLISRFTSSEGPCLGRLDLHAVFMAGPEHYPVNALRNIAHEYATRTDKLVFLDVDFVPSPKLAYSLVERLTATQNIHTAFVLPAFQTASYRPSLPQNKSEVLSDWNAGALTPFRGDVWPQAQAAVDYEKWRMVPTSSGDYDVQWQPNFEPYVAVKKSFLPEFDERFVGFGWNKVSWSMSLAAEGFSFRVVSDAWIIHLPHAPSPDLVNFRGQSEYKRCQDEAKLLFTQALVKKHGAKAFRFIKSQS